MVGSGKGLITSLGQKSIWRSKNNKKETLSITSISLKDISNIIKEFKDVPYEGYVRKRSKHITTDCFIPSKIAYKVYDE